MRYPGWSELSLVGGQRVVPNTYLRASVVSALVCVVVAVVLFVFAFNSSQPLAGGVGGGGSSVVSLAPSGYGVLPLSFEANQGQTDSRVAFLARGAGFTLFLTPEEAVLSFVERSARQSLREQLGFAGSGGAGVRMRVVGADPAARIVGQQQRDGVANYFIGNDPGAWQTGVPTFASVRYAGVYPGIDLVYYGNEGRLEYDFIVAPGADPRTIALDFAGAESLVIDRRGDLVLGVGGSEIRQHKPVVYQTINGARQGIRGEYVMTGEREVGFALGDYDTSLPLVIDPILVYSTYLGGSGNDDSSSTNTTVDGAGNAYVLGVTGSTDFPTAGLPFQVAFAGGGLDLFVAKLDPSGSALVYSTFLGGDGLDFGIAIAIDAAGNAYLTGQTRSADFPTTLTSFGTRSAGSPATPSSRS